MADDLYGIADEIEDLESTEGWGEGQEAPTVFPDDETDWVSKRLLAIRFRQEEATDVADQYEAQVAKLMAEIERLTEDQDVELATLRRSVKTLTGQLVQFHRARIAHAEREWAAAAAAAVEADRAIPKQKLPTTIKTPQGKLHSRSSSQVKVRVMEGKEAEVVAWLKAQHAGQGIRHKEAVPAQDLPDLVEMRQLVERDKDGKVLGILDEENNPCPWLSFEETGRAHWVTLPDGSSSKDWLVDGD